MTELHLKGRLCQTGLSTTLIAYGEIEAQLSKKLSFFIIRSLWNLYKIIFNCHRHKSQGDIMLI